LAPVSYRLKMAADSSPKSIGFVAQEVEPLFPELVSESDGIKGIAYPQMVTVAIGAIQELNQKVDEKDAEIKALNQRLNELEATVKSLSAKQ
jgi:hypothetical protein